MDEISLGSEGGSRPPPFRNWSPRRWIIVAVAVVIAASVPTVVQAARHHPRQAPGAAVPSGGASVVITAGPSPGSAGPAGPAGAPSGLPAAAVGTALVSCDAMSWWNLGSTWRPGSVRAGPLWLLQGSRYARAGNPGPSAAVSPKTGRGQEWSMIVHIDGGSRVVMRAAAGTSGYFHFVDGPAGPGYKPADGVPGLTFAPCGNQAVAPGWISLYQLTFYIVPGQAANVEVLTATSARPSWLRFTAPSP